MTVAFALCFTLLGVGAGALMMLAVLTAYGTRMTVSITPSSGKPEFYDFELDNDLRDC